MVFSERFCQLSSLLLQIELSLDLLKVGVLTKTT